MDVAYKVTSVYLDLRIACHLGAGAERRNEEWSVRIGEERHENETPHAYIVAKYDKT